MKGQKIILTIAFIVSLNWFTRAEGDGFGENPGGAGGDTVWVSNADDFRKYAASSVPYVIMVSDTIELGSSGAAVNSNKTICGTDSMVLIKGPLNIKGTVKNVVVKYLTITNPAGDGITIRDGATYIYIEHCTVYDCADGSIDITVESDFVTIAYCRFYYIQVVNHEFVNLIGADDSNVTDRGKLHVTFHHNWWDIGGVARMPLIRFGRVHMYNNYFGCFNNQYSSRARLEAELFSEFNYYDRVNDPFTAEVGGKAKSIGNVYDNCNGTINAGTDSVFRPSYPYNLTSAETAKADALSKAGNISERPVFPNQKKETIISWGNQSKIIYGTPVSEIQLSAKANGNTSLPVYSAPLGTILPGGGTSTITVTFPEDDNYKAASKTINIEVAWEYFPLSINLTNGALPELISVTPQATLLNGQNKYIKGTVVTLNAASNTVSTFDHWSDGDTNPIKNITINSDTEITAHYKIANYIVGWDFMVDGNKSRLADFYSSAENQTSTLELLHENGTTTNWVQVSGSNSNKWFDKYAAIIGKARVYAGKYYFQVSCNARDFENIRVMASMLGIYTFYQVQNVEYSTDGTNFKTAGSFSLEQDSVWYTKEFALPADANHAEKLTVRFVADKTSSLTQNGNDGTSISDIYIFADKKGMGYNSQKIGEKQTKKIISKQTFSVDGRKVNSSRKGLNIEITYYNDGTRKATKTIKH